MAENPSGNGKSRRGFASMDADKQRAIASKGGKSVPAEERSFSQNRALAAAAGRKGGEASHGGGRSARGGDSAAAATGGERSEGGRPDGAVSSRPD